LKKKKGIQRTKQKSSVQRFDATHWKSESEHMFIPRDPRMFLSETEHTTISVQKQPAASAKTLFCCAPHREVRELRIFISGGTHVDKADTKG